MSMDWHEEQQRKMKRSLRDELAEERANGNDPENSQDGGGDAE